MTHLPLFEPRALPILLALGAGALAQTPAPTTTSLRLSTPFQPGGGLVISLAQVGVDVAWS